MAITNKEVDFLTAKINLGGHEGQEDAVAAAIQKLLVEDRRGVVLADQVGFGKTYEALAIMALLSERAREARKAFDKVLVLCRPSLLGKWQEEISSTKPDKGFPRYLTGEHWPDKHPVFIRLLRHIRVISRRASAEEHRGVREGGKVQAPSGIYIVNQDVLSDKTRISRPFLKWLFQTEWDLIIVDEAHHYGRWTKPAYIFTPDGDMRNYEQGISGGRFGKILALTATPFELTPSEMVHLLAMIRADKGDLDSIEKGLELYVRRLDRFFSIRDRSSADPLRQQAVSCLRQLRDDDACESGLKGAGLESLMRRYIIRNTKSKNERRYFFVNKVNGTYANEPFDKLEDLKCRLKQSPLLPFEGPDALFYLMLRELIDQTLELSRQGTGNQTFITTDLRQGLSSYPQIEKSKLLNRDIESAKRLRQLVRSWNNPKSKRLHPKTQSLADVVGEIAAIEVAKVKNDPSKWFSKVIVFNKLIGGTAPHLRKVLEERLTPIFDQFLTDTLNEKGWGLRKDFSSLLRNLLEKELNGAGNTLFKKYGPFSKVP
jgi:SNF2 family DNA or RNA helicase